MEKIEREAILRDKCVKQKTVVSHFLAIYLGANNLLTNSPEICAQYCHLILCLSCPLCHTDEEPYKTK